VAFFIYKIYFKKVRNGNIQTIIETFGLIDKVNQNGNFGENYLVGIYEIFDKYNTPYSIMIRPYLVGKNPFKLIKFFKILNNSKNDFVFEYEFLNFKNFVEIFKMIILYPFKSLRIVQKNDSDFDCLFNECLINDFWNFNFGGITHYILGKNLSNIKSIERIFSWSEFQVIERAMNYGIRSRAEHITLIGLQFFLNYETYFNVIVDDLDYDMLSSPHEVMVNGRHYLQQRDKVNYNLGVSLRYKDVFNFQGIQNQKNILLLGSYIESDTRYMLKSIEGFDNVIFKNHPAVDIKRFGELAKNITISNENIYKLFASAKLVIGTASGTSVEAVACGISVIIMASQDNLTANSLVDYGKGKIWDIAYDVREVEDIYKKLIDYRVKNNLEIMDIANWYKDNFFIPLTDENLVKTFGFKL
jgi:hypothetical protein